jgi:CRISPR-associated protein (TIGR03984 family)
MKDYIKMDVIPPQPGEPERDWFSNLINSDRPYLLAFCDDGVIWGTKFEGKLVLSNDIDSDAYACLCWGALQQAFIFGENDEIRLFRGEAFYDDQGGEQLGKWQAVRILDGGEVISESQILWGDELAGKLESGFIRVRDNTKGIAEQVMPLDREELQQGECIRLDVHHIVEFNNDTGEARIALSRLAGLRVGLLKEVAK